ncbi:MAG: indolepyruvate oxidoreductase subunit beta [Treponema sp.]|jgi:indolepyruvate ferredoxin oxidoreductase beta subunit|nr:indolepyruvate oxidoreductase subunit beta [Treponema sp.]
MKSDCVLAGVGGQGVLSIAAIIAGAASRAGYSVRQSEVHGMAQRGGAVLAHLRLAGPDDGEDPGPGNYPGGQDHPEGLIPGDLIPRGAADMIISMEPLEGLRCLAWLSPEGSLITAAEPVLNIPNYPALEEIHGAVNSLPRRRLVEAAALAREAGLARAANMVMVGAASPWLPIPAETLENTIAALFAGRDPAAAAANTRAFWAGRRAALA